MKNSIILIVIFCVLSGRVQDLATSSPTPAASKQKPTDEIQTITLQYRTSMDAVAPSHFVAVYPNAMTIGLKVHWKIDNEKKKQLDTILAKLEKDAVNGKEFVAKGKWIREGFELEVYEIENSPFAQEMDARKISDFEKAVVAICHSKPDIKTIQGTGFIVESKGMIVTADHVITDKQGRVFNRLFGLRPNYPKVEPHQLSVVKRFRKRLKGRDIAILKIVSGSSRSNFPYIPVGENPAVGDSVLIVGFPLVFNKVYP